MKILHIFTISRTPIAFFDDQFRYLKEHGYEVVLACKREDGIEEFAERNGVKYIPVEIPRSMSPVAILKSIGAIKRIIKDEKPEAVFGHTPVGALCAMIAAKWCGVKNRIYYRHGVIYTTMKGAKYLLFKWEEKFVASLATAVVNVSHSLSRLAAKDHLNADKKQHVIGHGTCGGIDAVNIFNPALVNIADFESTKKKLGLNDVDIVFGFCGRICNDKGVPELIDAFELFRSKHKGLKAKLLLIGAMDIRDGVSGHYADKINEDKDIVLSGHVEGGVIPYYYAMLDVFVFPSHREGFGMCAIEASAMEKPLLVSKVHGCEDTIVEHLTGEYIGLDAESICQGMESMLDADKRRFLGKNGRVKVLEWYDFRVMWPLVKELYERILK